MCVVCVCSVCMCVCGVCMCVVCVCMCVWCVHVCGVCVHVCGVCVHVCVWCVHVRCVCACVWCVWCVCVVCVACVWYVVCVCMCVHVCVWYVCACVWCVCMCLGLHSELMCYILMACNHAIHPSPALCKARGQTRWYLHLKTRHRDPPKNAVVTIDIYLSSIKAIFVVVVVDLSFSDFCPHVYGTNG